MSDTFNVHRLVNALREFIGRDKHRRRQFTHDHPSRSKLDGERAAKAEAWGTIADHTQPLIIENERTGEKQIAVDLVWAPFNSPGADGGRKF